MRNTLPALSLVALAVATASGNVYSQTTETEQQEELKRSLEVIEVTATRRATSLADTPVAVSAVSGDELLQNGVTDPYGLTDSVPNVSIDMVDGGLNVTIRGVTSLDNTEKGDPSVNFMLDDVIIARPQAQAVSFFDVSRVEVLRGPQGTLFGRNTTGGAINVITNRPELGEFYGRVDGGVGNYGTRQVTGVLNAPVTDDFALRAAVNFDQQDNYLDGGPNTNGYLDEMKDNLSFRLTGLYQWDTGEVTIQYNKSQIDGQPTTYLPVENFYDVLDDDGNFAVQDQVDPRRFAVNSDDALYMNSNVLFKPYRDNDTDAWRLSLKQEIGPVDFFYVGSTRTFDSDALEARPQSGLPDTFAYNFYGTYDQDQHEFRLASNGDDALSWQAGYFIFNEESNSGLRINFAPNSVADDPALAFIQGPTINDSIGYFAQLTYELTDELRLTAGARYSEDEKSQRGYTVQGTYQNLEVADGQPYSNILDYESDKTTWKVGLDYDLNEDIMVYTNISTGYKAGGFNGGCIAGSGGAGCNQTEESIYYDPESLTSYEVGAKAYLFDYTLKFDAVAFMYDYQDLQLSGIVEISPGLTGLLTENAAEAEVRGFELESSYVVSDYSQIDLMLTILDSEYTNFYKEVEDIDLSGKPLSKTPDWTFQLGYTYTFELDGGATVDARVASTVSDSFVIYNNVFNNFWEQPGFSKTDINVTYRSAFGDWYVGAFVRNLEDSMVISAINATGSSRRYAQVQAPRTLGLRFGIEF